MERGDCKEEPPAPKTPSKSRLQEGDCNWPNKMPWVPAPGKATTVSNLPVTISSPSTPGTRAFKAPSYATHGKSSGFKLTPRPKLTSSVSGKRSYTLQSKDSLVDVTTCIQQKRERVLKLWQQNLQSKDPILLAKIEDTNRLALEAAQRVDHLKKAIHAMQSITTDKLTPQQTKQLDDLRTQVLYKLNEFEQSNEEINNIVAKRYADEEAAGLDNKSTQLDKTPGNSLVEELPEQTRSNESEIQKEGESKPDATSVNSLIVLKEKTSNFNAEDTEEEEETDGITKISYPSSVTGENDDLSSATATSVDLSRLAGMYEEPLSFPKLKPGKTMTALSSSSHCANNDLKCQGDSNMGQKYGNRTTTATTGCCKECKKYRKLAQQQKQEVMQVRMDLERVESEAMFQMRVLKSKLTETHNSMQGANLNPYLLPGGTGSPRGTTNAGNIWDKKLQQYAQSILESKMKDFEETLKLKKQEKCDSEMPKNECRDDAMMKEIELLRNQLAESESNQDKLKSEICELRKENNSLRQEVLNKEKEEVISKTAFVQTIQELKDNLKFANKKALMLQNAKDKMNDQMNRRVEQVMQEMEELRCKNSQLVNQIHFIRSSYQNLFPVDLFEQSSTQDVDEMEREREAM